jgi:hypothetical protein
MQVLIPRQNASKIYVSGLALLVIALPLSKFMMSVSQFVLAVYWVFGEDSGTTVHAGKVGRSLSGGLQLLGINVVNRFRKFFRSPSALLIASVFFIHVIGLLWSSDLSYGLEDVRKKIPLFIIPLVIATSDKLNRKQFDLIMYLFVAAVLAGTLVSMSVLAGIIPPREGNTHELIDIRNISIFISHIRFSLLIVLSVFVLGFYAWHLRSWKRLMCLALMVWLTIFLIILESITGLMIMLSTGLVLFIYYAVTRKEWWRKLALLAVIGGLVFGLMTYVKSVAKTYDRKLEVGSFSTLDTVTPDGHPYYNDTIHPSTENGNRVWIYVCWEELEQGWNQRSRIKFTDHDLKGNEIKYTIIRFLTSKGQRKDAAGINSLTNEEVHSIEKGIANVDEQGRTSLSARIHQIVWEMDIYREGGNPSGHSVTQRLEFWKAALGIIKEHPITGVGTGDVKNAFEQQYNKMGSPLSKEWRLRSHNQYLAITVALGFTGLVIFLLSLLLPMFRERRLTNYFYIVFFFIAMLSMFTEDTLETQAGVTFFAFFNAFFLFSRGKYEGEKLEDDMLGI